MIWLWLSIFILVICFGLVVVVGAPYVPTRRSFAKTALSYLYHISSNDTLVDVGSGDGIVLRYAASLGAKAVGFEINPILYYISRYLSRGEHKVDNRLANFWTSDLPDDTTVVYIFATSKDMGRLSKWLQGQSDRLGKPLSVVVLGSKFRSISPNKTVEPYNLYIFNPLQP